MDQEWVSMDLQHTEWISCHSFSQTKVCLFFFIWKFRAESKFCQFITNPALESTWLPCLLIWNILFDIQVFRCSMQFKVNGSVSYAVCTLSGSAWDFFFFERFLFCCLKLFVQLPGFTQKSKITARSISHFVLCTCWINYQRNQSSIVIQDVLNP